MAVIRGARIVLKENGQERFRKLRGENENAEYREKTLSWGVSGLDIIWMPSCKKTRRHVWHCTRCATRVVLIQEELAPLVKKNKKKENPSKPYSAFSPGFLFLEGNMVHQGDPLPESPWVFVSCDGYRFVPKVSKGDLKKVSKRKVSEGERRLLAMPNYCWKSVGPRRSHCQSR